MKLKYGYVTLALLMPVALMVSACVPMTPAPVTAPTEAPATEAMQEPTPEPMAEEEVVLKVMDNWGNQTDAKGPPLQSIFEDFMAAYPNITIEEEVFADTEIPIKIETAFLAGEEPDLILQNWGYGTLDWPDDGVAIDVGPLMEEWGLTDLFKEEALSQFTMDDGRVVAFPVEGFTWPIWYNMRILNEAGVDKVPETIDELIEAAQKVREAGYQPLVVGGLDWTGQSFFNVVNASTMPNDEFPAIYATGGFSQNQNFVDSVDLFVELRDAGVFADDSPGLEFASMNEMYFSGEAAMMHGGAWSFAECPDDVKQNTVVSGFPLPPDSPHAKPILPAGYMAKGLWITRNGSEKMDAVEKFVKFFFQPEMIARFVEQAGMTPPLKEVPVDESVLDPLFLQTLQWGDSIEYVEVIDLYIPTALWEPLTKTTKEAFLEGTPTDKIVADLDAAWESAE